MGEEVLNWWKQAKADFETAEFNAKGGMFEAAAFFSQQAVEKGLKAVYIKKFGELLKTHDLVLLGRKVGLPLNLIELCKSLTPAYIYTRYPDVAPINNMREVSRGLLSQAREVMKWVEKAL